MTFPPRLPVVLYEIAFIAAILYLIPLAFQGSVFKVLLALLSLYISLSGIRKYKKTAFVATGKSVFISGCDTGFGHGLALRLHHEGFRVFAGCLFPEGDGAITLKKKCTENLFVVPLDVTKDDSVREAEEIVRDNLGETCLWGLVNNAGILTIGDIELTSLQTFKHIHDVNVFGMLRLTKAFLPLIRKSSGRITNVSSAIARQSTPGVSAYASSKAVVESISDCLRMEMRKFGIKVSVIKPGSYGLNTQVFDGENKRRQIETAVNDWENLSDDIKAEYPIEYVRSQFEYDDRTKQMSRSKNVDPVIEAIFDSLVSSNPTLCKMVPGGPFLIDPFVVVPTLLEHLPTSFSDWFLCKMTGWPTGVSNTDLFIYKA